MKRNSFDRIEHTESPDVVVFIGSALFFSDWTMRAAASETGEMNVLRFDNLASADMLPLMEKRRLRLVVVESAGADDLFSRIKDDPGIAGSTIWAVAYRDVGTGRKLLEQRLESNTLCDLRLLPMNVPLDAWIAMFRLILCGDFFIPSELLRATALPSAIQPRAAPRDQPSASLTKREFEVLALVAKGGRNKCIAHELGLSEHTVKLHLHNIITKIGVPNRTTAANWFFSHQAEYEE